MSKAFKTGLLGIAMLMGLAISPASASLIGESVTGSLIVLGPNFFDPANGVVSVPLPYLNNVDETVTIGPEIEFGLVDDIRTLGVTYNIDEVNFFDTGFTVSDNVLTESGALPWEIKLMSSAFVGLVLLEVFDGFDNGIIGSLIGDTITLKWAGVPEWTGVPDGGKIGLRSASFSLLPNPVPLPAALPLFAAGLGAMGFMGWRRKRKTVAN